MNVRRLGLRTGGAEELYRTVLLAELSSEGQPQGPGPVVEGREAVAAAFAPVAPTDPGWRKRCLVVVGAVAGGTAAQEEEGEGMEVDGHGGEGGQGVKVTVEMTSGGDRAAFWKMAGLIPGEVGRTNRRWRRKVGGGGGKKGGGGGGVAESG